MSRDQHTEQSGSELRLRVALERIANSEIPGVSGGPNGPSAQVMEFAAAALGVAPEQGHSDDYVALRRGVSALVATSRCYRRLESKLEHDPGPCATCAVCMAKRACYGDDWRDR